MEQPAGKHSPFERLLGLFTVLRPGEGRSVALFFLLAFLILVAYYVLKTLREPLLLVDDPAEMKSYAYATIAGVLLIVIPAYGSIARHVDKTQLTRLLTAFFIVNLLIFYALGHAGVGFGFAYFVWVGIFGLMITAQFWGYAANTYSVTSGQRLFPVIMAGATAGGLVGPLIAGALYERAGALNLMVIVAVLLAVTMPLVSICRNAVPEAARSVSTAPEPAPHFLSGLALVARDNYLLLLALLILLLNWVNTTGEYILAEFVVQYADQRVLENAALDKGELINTFYSRFYFSVNALTVLIQVFLVARIFRWVGIRGAIIALPVLAILGYGLIAFIPVFSLVRIAKIAENSTDYSLMNTTRHALYLPLPEAHKFEGKTAIETLFWRLGDLIQAAVVFAGLHWLDFGMREFAMLNIVLGAVWLVIAVKLGREYHHKVHYA